MKIRFDNNSVSGVNRKYRGFVLDIPGQSSITVDIPSQYVNDAMSYLKYRHPAVVCTQIAAEKEKPGITPAPVIPACADVMMEENGAQESKPDEPAPTETVEEKKVNVKVREKEKTTKDTKIAAKKKPQKKTEVRNEINYHERR